jgi:hypothetical protein
MIDPLDKCVTWDKASAELFDPPLTKPQFLGWLRAAGVRKIRTRPLYVRLRECRDALARHDSSSIKNEEPGSSGTGPSATERVQALKVRLRVNSRNTSLTPTSPEPARRRSSAMSYSTTSTTGRKSG